MLPEEMQEMMGKFLLIIFAAMVLCLGKVRADEKCRLFSQPVVVTDGFELSK